MKKDCKIPNTFGQIFLNDVLRTATNQFFNIGVTAEIDVYMSKNADELTDSGIQRLYLGRTPKTKSVETNLGSIDIIKPLVYDRCRSNGHPILIDSIICPKGRVSLKYINQYMAWKYIDGLITGDFQEAKKLFLDPFRPNISKTFSHRLNRLLLIEHDHFGLKRQENTKYMVIWLDKVDLSMGKKNCCNQILLACGLTFEGKVELIMATKAKSPGDEDWTELFRKMKQIGLTKLPKLVTGIDSRQAYIKLKKVFRNYSSFKVDKTLLKEILNDLPDNISSNLRRQLISIYDTSTKYVINFKITNLILNYGCKYPHIIAALLGHSNDHNQDFSDLV
ncbi:MAG: transposase [Deltaproteobacteria bacterium]|nr:transposase [Deltaproteobacteria bacterium]